MRYPKLGVYVPGRLGVLCGALDSSADYAAAELPAAAGSRLPELFTSTHLAYTLLIMYGPCRLGAMDN